MGRAARRRLPVLAAVLALAATGCGEEAEAPVTVELPPPAAPPLALGVVANTLDARANRAREQRQVASLGAGWLREELRWPTVEPQPGVLRWESFDSVVEDAASRGLRVLPLLLGTPEWAGAEPLGLPEDVNGFARFAARAAARYGPGGNFWRERPRLDERLAPGWLELWNEPYFVNFAAGGVDPAAYARLVVAATAAGRVANPAVRWLMAADLTYLDADDDRRPWLAELFAAEPGLGAAIDGVAIHPYSFGPPQGEQASLAFRFDRTNAILDRIAQLAGRRLPAWITEIGWSTCDLRPDCVSEHDQAAYLAELFALVRRPPLDRAVRAMFVYHLRDFPDSSPDDREAHFGLLRVDETRKPAWAVVRRIGTLSR